MTVRLPGAHPDSNATGAVMIELALDRIAESGRWQPGREKQALTCIVSLLFE